MKAHTQYTIRNIPEPVDRYLRKRARLSGRSLNQTILDELSERAGVSNEPTVQSLDWFIGSGRLDDMTCTALAEDDAAQKQQSARELGV